ncbi:MAG TPA: M28 family peptidase, partial [Thermoanaerobaculia bacterium]|nr:M28 family peptidase [Thermoanaerobaculia bacterium]
VKYFASAMPSNGRIVVDTFEASNERTHDRPAHFENVYLVVPGSDVSREKTVVLVSGHFDTICSDFLSPECDAPGADDDGSGTTVSLESARLVARRPHRATIVFAAVSGEEQGLFGGKRLLEWTQAQGYAVAAMLNNDIVGATNGSADRRPRVFCDADAFTPSRELGMWIDEFVGGVRPVFRRDRFRRGGDQLPFVEAGLPAIRFCEPKEDYRHQHQTVRTEGGVEYGDLQKFMDFDFLAEVAQKNAEAVDRLANAPAAPAEATVEGAVKPTATLTFTAPDDPERSGFEILARDTTEPRWKVLEPAPTPGTYALPLPIDNEFFAVRAVGRNGIRSIAVDAKPDVRKK